MKKAISLLLSLALAASLAACGGQPQTGGQQQTGTGTAVDTPSEPEPSSKPNTPASGPVTTILYSDEELEAVELPQVSLSDLRATPLEGTVVSTESVTEDQVKISVLQSTGRTNLGHRGTKDGGIYFLAENPLDDIGIGYGLYSYRLQDGIREEERAHYAEIGLYNGGTAVAVGRLFDGDGAEYEVDIEQHDRKPYPQAQVDELASLRVYRGVSDPTMMYVSLDSAGQGEIKVEGEMLILLVKDGIIVNCLSWDILRETDGDSKKIDFPRFDFEDDYDSVYVQLDIDVKD